MAIVFTCFRQPKKFEWLSCGSPHQIQFKDKNYPTTEHLLQAMRFWGTSYAEDIRSVNCPQIARIKGRLNMRRALVQPFSDQDLVNLWTCMVLKLKQHPELIVKLLSTGEQEIIEDVSFRKKPTPWGCKLIGGRYIGENIYGKMWTHLREMIKQRIPLLLDQIILGDLADFRQQLYSQNFEEEPMTQDPIREHLLAISKIHGLNKLKYLSGLIEVPHNIQSYQVDGLRFQNLITLIQGTTKPEKKVLVTAHHDIVNPKSENCLDNNGSVMNLLRLMNSVKNPRCTIIMAFTDAEETMNIRYNGISQILAEHMIDQHVDLELTSSGDIPAITTYNDFDVIEDAHPIKQPGNNAMLFARHDKKPRGSACITLLNAERIEEYSENGFCTHWLNCHKTSDKVDQWYDRWDCDNFVHFLTDTLSNYE